jgi:hypothetical protein
MPFILIVKRRTTAMAAPLTMAQARRLRRQRPSFREWPSKHHTYSLALAQTNQLP